MRALGPVMPERVTAEWGELLCSQTTGLDNRPGKEGSTFVDICFMGLKGGSRRHLRLRRLRPHRHDRRLRRRARPGLRDLRAGDAPPCAVPRVLGGLGRSRPLARRHRRRDPARVAWPRPEAHHLRRRRRGALVRLAGRQGRHAQHHPGRVPGRAGVADPDHQGPRAERARRDAVLPAGVRRRRVGRPPTAAGREGPARRAQRHGQRDRGPRTVRRRDRRRHLDRRRGPDGDDARRSHGARARFGVAQPRARTSARAPSAARRPAPRGPRHAPQLHARPHDRGRTRRRATRRSQVDRGSRLPRVRLLPRPLRRCRRAPRGHPDPRRPAPSAVHHGLRPARGLPLPPAERPLRADRARPLVVGDDGAAQGALLHAEGHRRLARSVRPLLRDGGRRAGRPGAADGGLRAVDRRRRLPGRLRGGGGDSDPHRAGQPGHAGPVPGRPAAERHLLHGQHGAARERGDRAPRTDRQGQRRAHHPGQRALRRRHARAHPGTLGCASTSSTSPA